jgi:hypothetical protein
MPLATLRARLANIDARAVSLEATKRALEAYAQEIHDLFGAPFRMTAGDASSLDDAVVRKTPTYRLLRALSEYGVEDGELSVDFEQTVERLLPLLRKLHLLGHLPSANAAAINPKPFADTDEFVADIDTFAFDSELGAALVAAWARTLLAREQPLSATQLAVLAGRGSVAVGNAIRAGTLKAQRRHRNEAQKKRNPYLIKPAEARRFLRERAQADAEVESAD